MSFPDDSDRNDQLHRACAELEQRLRNGQPCSAEEILAAQPELAEHPACAWELIYTEFVARLKLGQRPQPQEWLARFPRWREDLSQIFHIHQLACDSNEHVNPGSTVDRAPPAIPPPESSPGESHPQQIGRFRIQRFVGEGSFGRVYQAHDPSLKRTVALKVARPEQFQSEERIERFLREARAAANLLHPHIVPVFDSGQDGPHRYIASAFISGQSLDVLLRQLPGGKPLPIRQAVAIVRHLAEALAYAHKSGVIHRDVKPGNVMLRDDGEPMLMDFGLAVRADEKRMTAAGMVLGTPAYMAPEQCGVQP